MTLRAYFQMTRPQSPIVAAGGMAAKDWYVFFYNLYNAVTQGLPQEEESLTVDTSPMTYQAVIRGQVHVSGGTVSAIEFSRDGSTFYDSGQTSGFVQMDARDYLRVTYSVAPTIVFFPM